MSGRVQPLGKLKKSSFGKKAELILASGSSCNWTSGKTAFDAETGHSPSWQCRCETFRLAASLTSLMQMDIFSG